MKTETPRPMRLKDYEPSRYLIDDVALDITLDATRTRVLSKLKVRLNPACAQRGGPLVLDGEALELGMVRIDGETIVPGGYEVTDSALTIARAPDGPFELEIESWCNPSANHALQGLYLSRGNYCTQCEAEGFRRITYFIDRPDILSSFTTRIEADVEDAPVLLGNGNPIKSGKLAKGKRHFVVWHDPFPKPCYLFALVGGKLACIKDSFVTRSKRRVALAIYVEPGKEDRCDWAMDSLKRSMKWDEEKFGREYDLDVFNIVAVSDFNMGAMENKGLNIFNDRLVLASPQTATDANFADIERVIAHEYFHNWTGNRITCRDWFQLCLKEGLTVYRDQQFCADMRSATVQRIQEVRQLKARQFPEDAGPLAHPVRPDAYVEINNFYTATVYEKGAELVRMVATLLGETDFRRGMDLYFERHDGEAATVEQFIACFAEVSGRDLSQFMTWYHQAGTPQIVCALKYDAKKRTAQLSVEQVLPPTPGETRKKPVHLPLKLGLISSNGQEIPLKLAGGPELADGIVEVKKRSETFTFVDVPSRPVASLLRGFSAPVNLTVNQTDRDLEFLMTHDSDLFNRWQAAQDYAMRTLVASVKALRKGLRPDKPSAFVAALAAISADERFDPAYRAQILTLPSETDVARVLARDVDPTLIHRARRTLRRQIATQLAEPLASLYEQHAPKGPFKADNASTGARALRLAALALITARGRPEEVARAVGHFRNARNATDEIGALSIVSQLNVPEREDCLDRFYKRWHKDHLVINTWFGVQAAAPLPSALATVRRLAAHPDFSLRNPNKVYALIGTFASANPMAFNSPSGKGYDFVAGKVLEIDAFNPQVAARLLGAFRSWRALEAGRRSAAKRALQTIRKTPTLSRDVLEIVTKMLD